VNYIKYCFGIALLLSISNCYADTFLSESEIKPFLESVMSEVAKGNISEGIIMLKPYTSVPEEKMETAILQSKLSRKQSLDFIGRSIGYEFLGEKRVGSSLIRLIYLEKTENYPITWMFIFYKNNNGWVIPSFKFSLDTEIPFIYEHD